MNRKKLLTIIRKLLALGTSPNEHEASAALAKARELMDEHGISAGSLDAPQREPIATKEIAIVQRQSVEMKLTAQIIKDFFAVTVMRSILSRRPVARPLRGWKRKRRTATTYALSLVGRADRVEVAAYVWRFLLGVSRILVRQHRPACRQSFLIGIFDGFSTTLTVVTSKSRSLVVADPELDDYLARTTKAGRKRSVIIRSPDVYEAAVPIGKEIQLTKAIAQ